MRRGASALIVAVLAAGMLAGSATGSSAAKTDKVERRAIDVGGGRKVYLVCKGTGSPTLILESGYHESSDSWFVTDAERPVPKTPAFTLLSRTYRTCAYDRPGTLRLVDGPPRITKRTTPVPMPRTAADVVSDLHTLLAKAKERGPFVLVAHSLGGMFARLYAQTYPRQVAGVVFVDSFPIEIPELFGDKWPAYRAVLDASGSQPAAEYEQIDVDVSVDQVRAAPPLSGIPLVVLTKTEPFGGLPPNPVGFTADDLNSIWRTASADLVALAPQTPQIFAAGSDHYIHVHQPDLVARATDLVVDRAQAR